MLFRDGSEDHLMFRSGRAPREGEVALPSGLAESAALRVSDEVDVLGPSNERATLVVSGIFEPPAASDPFWFGEDTPFPRGDEQAPVPVVVDRSTAADIAARIDLTTHFVWDIYLHLIGITYAEARDLPDRYVSFSNQIAQEVNGGTQLAHVASGISVLLARVQRAAADLRVPILLVLAQILVVTLVVLAGVGVLLVTRQSFELAVMHSRGFTGRALLLVQGLQAFLAAVIAFPVGIAVGALLARFAGATNGPRPGGIGFQTHLSASSLAFGGVTAAVGAVVLWLPSIPATRRTILDERRQASREGRPTLARAPLELIVLPVGIFALAQLRNGVAAVAATGEGSVDPLLLFGPTLVILGASFLVVRALSWGLGSLDGRVARSRRVSTYLAGRRLGRAPGVAFASAILIVLSVGLLFIATSYRATTLQNHADAAHAFAGADWVVDVGAPTSGPEGFGHMLPDHMSAAAQVPLEGFHGVYTNGPDGLAVDPATFADAAWWRSDFADGSLETLMDRLRPPPVGAELPAGSQTLNVTIDAPDAASGFVLRSSSLGVDGGITITRPATVAPGRHTYVLDVGGATRLLSLTFNRPTPGGADEVTMDIRVTTGEGTPVPLDGWTGLNTSGSTGEVAPDGDAGRFTGRFAIGSQIIGLQPKPAAVPAIVSSDVAGQEPIDMDVNVGPTVIPIHVVGTADAFPSFTPGTAFVILSGPALLELEGAAPDTIAGVNQVWVRGDEDPTAAIQAAGLPVTGVLSAARIEGQLAEAPQSLAVGLDAAAAIAGLGLVIAGVTATLYFAQRRREFEFASLRAMGAGAATVRDTIAREQIALVGVASLAGIALGYLVLRLASAPLLDAVNTSFPTPVVVVDVRTLTVALVVIGIAAAAAVAAATRAALRASITTVLRGDPE
jgi:hypothetical protein